MSRPKLGDRHAPLFAALTAEQVERVWSKVKPTLDGCSCDDPLTGGDLMTICAAHDMDHAGVIMCMAREYDAVGVGALEALAGHKIVKIVPWSTTAEAAAAAAPQRAWGRKQPAATTPRLAGAKPLASLSAVVDWDAARSRVVTSVVAGLRVPDPRKPGVEDYTWLVTWRVGDTADVCMRRVGMRTSGLRKMVQNGWVTLAEARPATDDTTAHEAEET